MTADRADFGGRLRQARESRGISLAQIAGATKISTLALEALERNDVSRLPGGLFSRAFVRAYAREVGLDPEQTVQEFAERFGDGLDGEPIVRSRTKGIDATGAPGSRTRWVGLLVTVVLVVAFVALSRYLNRQDDTPPAPSSGASTPAAAPRATTPPQTPPAPPLTPPAAGSNPATEPPLPQSQTAPLPTAGTSSAPGAQPPSDQTGQAAGQPPASDIAGAANLPLRVVLMPKAACWVSAKVDGKQLPGRLLQPGERVELAAGDSIALTAGDAGALGYTVNNSPGRPLGNVGQVAKVVITRANYETFVSR